VTEVTRTLVVWCADWPVVAAGVPLDEPAAVFHANRVVACSPAARAEGVERHLRRRDAQARCPELVVLEHDPAAEARAFEPVPAALEALTPRIEITYPGACAFPTRGPSRYHGGDRALADKVVTVVAEALAGRVPVGVGVADGPFAAGLAARRRPPGPRLGAAPVGAAPVGAAPVVVAPVVVAVGGSPDFLAPLPVSVLAEQGGPVGPETVDVLERLGIRTLGDLAALPVAEVVGRFGAEGRTAHRLARGLDERTPRTLPPPPELSLTAELDPPAERVEAAAFVARGLVDDLQARLAASGSACTRLVIGAETEHGETHERVWRTEGTFTAPAIADRVRWQLDGWLHAGAADRAFDGAPPRGVLPAGSRLPGGADRQHVAADRAFDGAPPRGVLPAGSRLPGGADRQHVAHRPSGGLTRLWLAPDEIVPAGGRQLAFSAGGPGSVDAVEAGDRAARALARVQGLLGVEAVRVPEWRGGRGPAERVGLVAVAADDVTEPRPAAQPGWVAEPWPGLVPDPAPATVHRPPVPAEVVDAAGRQVQVSGRGEVSAPPAAVAVARGAAAAGPPRPAAPVPLAAWAGPWPCDERWWDVEAHQRRARIQVTTTEGAAYLLAVEAGRWWVEATYD
jgi:protein ImuB